ncbi:hypothetical protein IT399_03095 [Candidatus Nomurabacteria bacterium]|nr:hypothetical protein [Candidatus Nomurabacteria bacterium]
MENEDKTYVKKQSVHHILAHSYSVYLFFFLIGVSLDYFFDFKVFNAYSVGILGLLLMMFGTFLIIWAQYTSHHLNKENINKETFSRGPYRFTRIPTSFGIFFLVLGFGFIINAFFVILSAFISFVVAKFLFIEKQEKVLAEKYGTPYLEYKKSVKF